MPFKTKEAYASYARGYRARRRQAGNPCMSGKSNSVSKYIPAKDKSPEALILHNAKARLIYRKRALNKLNLERAAEKKRPYTLVEWYGEASMNEINEIIAAHSK